MLDALVAGFQIRTQESLGRCQTSGVSHLSCAQVAGAVPLKVWSATVIALELLILPLNWG